MPARPAPRPRHQHWTVTAIQRVISHTRQHLRSETRNWTVQPVLVPLRCRPCSNKPCLSGQPACRCHPALGLHRASSSPRAALQLSGNYLNCMNAWRWRVAQLAQAFGFGSTRSAPALGLMNVVGRALRMRACMICLYSTQRLFTVIQMPDAPAIKIGTGPAGCGSDGVQHHGDGEPERRISTGRGGEVCSEAKRSTLLS